MFTYYPGLRFKLGECSGATQLAPDIRRHVEPRFVVPPPKEYDQELGRVPTIDEIAYVTGERIGKHWPVGRAFLDTHHIAKDLDDKGLRKLFHLAQGRNPMIVPVATLEDLHNPLFREIQCSDSLKLAVLVGYEEVDVDAISEALKVCGLTPSDCVVFIDFTGAPLDPKIAVGSVSGIFDLIDQVGLWQKIIFQGSNFPPQNPAGHGASELIPRDEWTIFHAAVKECSVSPDRIGYGDFAADCGEMVFPVGKGGGRAIRHLRYTTPTHTLVVRGKNEGTDESIMQNVCQRIISSGHYAGQQFSKADDQILRVAKLAIGPGTSTMWRAWNTNHHVTRVVRDLGAMLGLKFADGDVSPVREQTSLFADEEENSEKEDQNS